MAPNTFQEMLTRAAELAAKDGLDSQAFMTAAWKALLDAHPGMRDEIADKELRKQLRRLREQGLIGVA